MTCASVRVLILGGGLIFVAGCGGSSGGVSSGGSGGDSPTTVTFTVKGATPTAVATQIGSGSFTAAMLSGGQLALKLPGGTTNFAVAFVCPPTSLTTINPPQLQTFQNVFEATTLDGTSFTESCPALPSTPTTGTLTGSVDASAISGANLLEVYAQNDPMGFPFPVLGSSGGFSIAAPLGTDRVLVLAYNFALSGNIETLGSLAAAKNFSSQVVPGALNGGNTVVLGTADATTLEPISFAGVPSGYSAPAVLVGFETSGGGVILVGTAETNGYPALPAGAQQSGDSYVFSATAHSTSNPGEQVRVNTALASAGPESFTFPTAWTYAGPAAAAWPSFNVAYAGFAGKTGVTDGVVESWTTGATTTNLVIVIATGNSLNGSTTLAVPDLSGLAGFLAAPASGTNLVWTAEISQGSGPSVSTTSNRSTMMVSNAGTFVVP